MITPPDYKIKFETSSLSFPIGARLNFLKTINKRFFLDCGTNLISFNKTKITDDSGSKSIFIISKSGFFSAGFEYKKFGISFRHYTGKTMDYTLNRDVLSLRYQIFSTKSKEKQTKF